MRRYEHRDETPTIHPTAVVAPTAVLCGDVTLGRDSIVLWGASLVAESGPIRIGEGSLVKEHAVLRGVARHPLTLGDHVLVGPHAHLSGCTVEDEVFVATGASLFNGARIGKGGVVRVNAVVQVGARVPPGSDVPIGWVAVGDPAECHPPADKAAILEGIRSRGFSRIVFGLPSSRTMRELTDRYRRALAEYRTARPVGEGDDGYGVAGGE